MTKDILLMAMEEETNIRRLGLRLEIYALEALENNEFRADDQPMKELMNMLSNHVLTDYYLNRNEKDEPWHIRRGAKALLFYLYCCLREFLPHPDMGHVLLLGEKLHYAFEPGGRADIGIDERRIRHVMTILDEKFSYTKTVFGETVPAFLILDASPITQKEISLRSGCEEIHKGFVFWSRGNSMLPVPRETALLLKLSDALVWKAWITDKQRICERIAPKLAEIGYGWIPEKNDTGSLKHIGDLTCIGLACDTPLFGFMPFSDQSATFRNRCREIAEELIEIVSRENPFRSIAFL